MVQNQRLQYLFEKYLDKTYSSPEKNELFQYIMEAQHDEELKQLIKETWDKEFALHEQDSKKGDIIFQNIIEQRTNAKGKVRKLRFWRYAAAASILILLSVGGYFVLNNKTQKQTAIIETQKPKSDVAAPSTNRAMITLANGRQIVLDSAGNGTLALLGNVKVIKLANGEIAYKGKSNEVQYNTLTNPKGSNVVNIMLADGSKIWLNAGSSITYPTAFMGKERKVEVTGEGYFEVAHNAAKPFKVFVKGIEVQVLGTHFNINAYNDEGIIKTTLLEGLVKVTKGSTGKMIKPGEQAQIENQDNHLIPKIMVQTVDLNEVMAWKDGRFYFMSADMETIMRQLERWYDVEVVMRDDITNHFTGIISRSVNVSEVFDMLQKTGTMKVSIEGRKIFISK